MSVPPLLILFIAISAGVWLGARRVGGVSFGSSAVFFVALAFGYYGFELPHAVTELGLVLFVYSVGLQAGPRFLGRMRADGGRFLLIGLGATGAGALATIAVARMFDLAPQHAAGVFAGSTTCTPALAAAIDVIRRVSPEVADEVSVGYAIAYPLSVISVVLLVQSLPRIVGESAAAAAEKHAEEQRRRSTQPEAVVFRVTNPNCAGQTAADLGRLHVSRVVFSRLKRGDAVVPIRPDTVLALDDFVLAVGPPDELAKLETLLGDASIQPMADPAGNVSSRQLRVSRADVFGKTLRQLAVWQRFGITVTRIRRGEIEFTPHGDTELEPGDVLRVVGTLTDIDAFTDRVGRDERRLDQTSLVPFCAGIALGLAVGIVPIPLPGGMSVQIGAAGGAFLVALALGHFGRVGRQYLHVPGAARLLAQDLGLVIFLAGAGLGAGRGLLPVLEAHGFVLLAAGAFTTFVTILAAVLLTWRVLRWNVLAQAGATSACMTNPAAYGAALNLARSDAAATAFASVYPIALLAKIVLGQIVYLVLRGTA